MSDPNQTPNEPQGPGGKDPGRPEGSGPQPPNKLGRSLMGWVIIIGMAVLLMTFLRSGMEHGREITITDFWQYVEAGQVTGDIIIEKDTITGENTKDVIVDDKEGTYKFHVQYNHRDDERFTDKIYQAAKDNRGKFDVKFKPTGWWEMMLPHLLMTALVFLAIWFFVFRRMGVGGGGGGMLGSFGRSKHRLTPKDQTGVTFGDVAGVNEAKEEVSEIIEFLRNPQRFRRLGGRIPRGVLLVGEPGCGKTLLAKAIAGEADVPFFSISGSDFVEMFVGVGASRVRDLFKQAKERSPCIIFLDEIDAVGRRRGASFVGGGHDEREQTLNAILVEMDGFDSSDQVIVIAATNRMDVLDPALTRPGRFDRQIDVPLPDLQGRYEILKIYADKITCDPNIDLRKMARGTPMFSGADLAALVNEAAIAATMGDKEYVDLSDMEEARDKVRWGRARKNRAIDETERECTAYHEAGHALVQVYAPGADPLHKVSIIPRGRMGGATFSLPEKDRYIYTRKYCDALLAVCYGGRIAEEVFCGDSSSGASNDIAQATAIARRMVLDWGMSEELGLVHYGNGAEEKQMSPMFGQNEYSDKTADLIDKEIKAIVDGAYRSAREMIESNRDKVERLAQALLKYETLGADEVTRILDGEMLDKPTVSDLIGIEQAKTGSPENETSTDQDDAPESSEDSPDA
ncbi:MAG: ATP-dependent zinc metalloprotease FtsH [Phycisphaerae bacterium]|nr:ATP-dependent zinc metalloprotease FtsH [Phycisphaerae bacterium]